MGKQGKVARPTEEVALAHLRRVRRLAFLPPVCPHCGARLERVSEGRRGQEFVELWKCSRRCGYQNELGWGL